MTSHGTWTAVLLGVMLVAGCGRGEVEGRNGSPPSAGWVQHDDPAGFVMQFPKGWSATLAGSAGSFTIRAGDPGTGAFVAVHPIPPAPGSADAWLRARQLAVAELTGGAGVTEVEPVGDASTARAKATWTTDGKRWRASLLCAKRGSAGMLYLIAAPEPAFDARRDMLIRVLNSFRFIAPRAPEKGEGAPRRSVEWVQWSDPKENAFTLDIPKGWKIEGGLIRFNALDPRAVVGATSPDGTMNVRFGDASYPTCIEPFSPYFPEGSTYSPGYGTQMLVKRYFTGEMYAQDFVARVVAGHYTNPRMVKSTDLREKVAAINQVYAQQSGGVMQSSLSLGELAFTCEGNGRAMSGYCIAMTRRTADKTGGIWNVEFLAGFLAPSERAVEAGAVAQRMVTSFRLNPAWVKMQQNLTASVSGIVAKTNAEISGIINDGYWTRQAAQDDVARKHANAILGLTDLVDADTGVTYKVTSGSNYYWSRPGDDTVVGTDTADRPGIDFAPLREW